jgi:hypothetical protein
MGIDHFRFGLGSDADLFRRIGPGDICDRDPCFSTPIGLSVPENSVGREFYRPSQCLILLSSLTLL